MLSSASTSALKIESSTEGLKSTSFTIKPSSNRSLTLSRETHGKITLYKEKTVVKKNVPESEAVDALIDLIKENGDWVDKSN